MCGIEQASNPLLKLREPAPSYAESTRQSTKPSTIRQTENLRQQARPSPPKIVESDTVSDLIRMKSEIKQERQTLDDTYGRVKDILNKKAPERAQPPRRSDVYEATEISLMRKESQATAADVAEPITEHIDETHAESDSHLSESEITITETATATATATITTAQKKEQSEIEARDKLQTSENFQNFEFSIP